MNGLRVMLYRQLSAAWHYRWQAVLFAWLVCAVGWAGVFAIPNQYESSARMYVDADAVLTPRLRGLAVSARLDREFAEKFLAFVVREVIQHHQSMAADALATG